MNQLIDNVNQSIAWRPGTHMRMASKKGKDTSSELPEAQLEVLREAVRRYVKTHRLTQTAIGEIANGVGQSAISTFLNGGGIKLVNAIPLAEAVGVELSIESVGMSAMIRQAPSPTDAPYARRIEEIDLAIAIGECADSALRRALKDFYRERSDSDATATVKHHLYGLDRSAERAKTEREWADDVRAYYNRIRKGAASPFGR